MWKIKRGSFSDRRFENGGQCGRTYPSHIFRECPPPRGDKPYTEVCYILIYSDYTNSKYKFMNDMIIYIMWLLDLNWVLSFLNFVKKLVMGIYLSMRLYQWRNRWGQGGKVPPRDFWPGNFCWPTRKGEKSSKEKRETGAEKKEKLKKGRWKIGNGRRKSDKLRKNQGKCLCLLWKIFLLCPWTIHTCCLRYIQKLSCENNNQ